MNNVRSYHLCHVLPALCLFPAVLPLILFYILLTCLSPLHDGRFGDYGALYKELLEDKDNNEEWHVWYPVDGHFPTDDDLKGFKAR